MYDDLEGGKVAPYSLFALPLPKETLNLFEAFDGTSRASLHGSTREQSNNGVSASLHSIAEARAGVHGGAGDPSHRPRRQHREEELLDKLLSCDEDSAHRVLRRLEELRPQLFQRAREAPLPPLQLALSQAPILDAQLAGKNEAMRIQAEHDAMTLPELRLFAAKKSCECAGIEPPPLTTFQKGNTPRRVAGTAPVIQFMSFIFFCNEDEQVMKLDVMRAGDLTEKSEACFRTRDLSAVAGVTYRSVSKRIRFAPGQDMLQVEVPIISSMDWDTTTEFACELHEGDGLVNATLGRYLWAARVKVIDNDCFPSSLFDKQLRNSQDVHNVPRFGLFMEYMKLNWHTKTVRSRSLRCMAIDQLHNVYSFLGLFINVYLVDNVLNPEKSSGLSKPMALLAIAAFLIVPFGFLHILDHRKLQYYGVGSPSCLRLQVCLLRKFLNYNNHARTQITSGDLVMAMTRDASMVVADGYVECMKIVKELGQLCLMLTYPVLASVVFEKPFILPSLVPYVPLFLFPILMAAFIHVMLARTMAALEKRNICQNFFVGVVNETVDNYRIIADYGKRELFINMFTRALSDFNGANRAANVIIQNNKYFAKWLPILFIAGWIVLGGGLVPETISIGIFLANINVCTNIGKSCFNVYEHILEIIAMMPALYNVVVAMNLPTDLPHRKELNRARRKRTGEERTAIKTSCSKDERPAVDQLCIRMGDIVFTYTTMHTSRAMRKTELKHSGMIDLEQGETVFFVGPRGGGKSTLLKIMGGELLPDPKCLVDGGGCGQFFVPSHLRVLHVSHPLFYDATLHANLTFGCNPGDEDARVERVELICRMLGVDEKVLDHLRSEDTMDWDNVFSETQCQLLSIGRALVSNPEVLCIHKPTERFPENSAMRIWGALSIFVAERGTVQKLPKGTRRPRTCLASVVRGEHYNMADKLYHISEGAIRRVNVEEARSLARSEFTAHGCGADSGSESLPMGAVLAPNGRGARGSWGSKV